MILDSERQKQDLVSLLKLVPFQGNIAQGLDKMVDEVRTLIAVVENAKVADKSQELVK